MEIIRIKKTNDIWLNRPRNLFVYKDKKILYLVVQLRHSIGLEGHRELCSENLTQFNKMIHLYQGADKSLARQPRRLLIKFTS
jgi:hypothetical protein